MKYTYEKFPVNEDGVIPAPLIAVAVALGLFEMHIKGFALQSEISGEREFGAGAGGPSDARLRRRAREA